MVSAWQRDSSQNAAMTVRGERKEGEWLWDTLKVEEETLLSSLDGGQFLLVQCSENTDSDVFCV